MPETKPPNTELPQVLLELGYELDRVMITAAIVERAEERNPSKPPRRPRRRRFALAIATVVAIAIAAELVVGIGRDGTSVGVDQALAEVAHRIEVAPDPRADQFEYTRSVSSYVGLMPSGIDYRGREFEAFVFMRPRSQSSWLSPTRDGAMVTKAGTPTYPTPGDARRGESYFEALDYYENARRTGTDRAQIKAINKKIIEFNRRQGLDGFSTPEGTDVSRATVTPSGGTYIGNELLSADELAKFPHDPQALYARVRQGVERQVAKDEKFYATLPARDRELLAGNPDADEEVWQMLSGADQTLGKFPMPKDLRAAMVRALAELPGVRFDGDATDRYGRDGDQFVWDHEGRQYTVVFDRETSVLLSASTVVVDPSALTWQPLRHLPAGTVLSSYQLIDQKTVEEIPAEAKKVEMPGARPVGP